MSLAVDVDLLLVYAFNLDSSHHAQVEAFPEERVRGREIFCIAWQTAMARKRFSEAYRALAPRAFAHAGVIFGEATCCKLSPKRSLRCSDCATHGAIE